MYQIRNFRNETGEKADWMVHSTDALKVKGNETKVKRQTESTQQG